MADEFARSGGGPLGVVDTAEVVVSARDLAAEEQRWQHLLDPIMPAERCHSEVCDGPAIRLVKGRDDGIEAVVWRVRSLGRAADWLRSQGWLGGQGEHELSIVAEPMQGLNVQLTD